MLAKTDEPFTEIFPAVKLRRYKGRPSGKIIARDFPFIVEIAMPAGGLGTRLNEMHSFHDQRSIQVAPVRHGHEDDEDFMLWCFARRAIAEEFAVEFGGKLMG